MYRLICCLLLAGLPSCAAIGERGSELTDHEAISQVLDDWNQGWATKDAALATSGYTSDADFTNAFGFHRSGRAEIEAYIAEVFGLDFVMAGKSREVSRDFRFLRPDVALVRTRVERLGQETPSGESLGTREITHLRVFVERDGEWHITSHLISDARATELADH